MTSTAQPQAFAVGKKNVQSTATVVDRHCDKPNCNVNKLIKMVPPHEHAQYVLEPFVVEKPLLVNGLTTFFNVGGVPAKLNDIRPSDPTKSKKIYRIVPNMHSHIVNYLVMDEEGEMTRKLYAGNPELMGRLLDCQRSSANQMLQKLMDSSGAGAHVLYQLPPKGTNGPQLVPSLAKRPGTVKLNSGSVTITSAPAATTTTGVKTTTSITALRNSLPKSLTVKQIPAKSTPNVINQPATLSTSLNQTPVEMNSTAKGQLQIRLIQGNNTPASYAGSLNAKPINQTINPTTTNVVPPPPLPQNVTLAPRLGTQPKIKTVPLAQLQKTPIAQQPITMAKNRPKPAPKSSPNVVNNDIAEVDKVRKELEELKQTVAILAQQQGTHLLTQPEPNEPRNKRAKF